MRIVAIFVLFSTVLPWIVSMGCNPVEPGGLDKLGTVRLTIGDREFELWIADEPAEQARGLMFVSREQMAALPDGTERGMLFVFDRARLLTFWMKDVMIPLDIAYLDTTGTIVAIHTMAPLDDRPGQYPSGQPAQFAIEVNGNLFERLGVKPGDPIEIPPSVLKRLP